MWSSDCVLDIFFMKCLREGSLMTAWVSYGGTLRRLSNPGWEIKQSVGTIIVLHRLTYVHSPDWLALVQEVRVSTILFFNRNLTGAVRLEGGDNRSMSYGFLSASKLIVHLFIDKYPVSSEKEVAKSEPRVRRHTATSRNIEQTSLESLQCRQVSLKFRITTES